MKRVRLKANRRCAMALNLKNHHQNEWTEQTNEPLNEWMNWVNKKEREGKNSINYLLNKVERKNLYAKQIFPTFSTVIHNLYAAECSLSNMSSMLMSCCCCCWYFLLFNFIFCLIFFLFYFFLSLLSVFDSIRFVSFRFVSFR